MSRYQKVNTGNTYRYPHVSNEYPKTVRKVPTNGESIQWGIYTQPVVRSQVVKPSPYFYLYEDATMLFPTLDRDSLFVEQVTPPTVGMPPVSTQNYDNSVVRAYNKWSNLPPQTSTEIFLGYTKP